MIDIVPESAKWEHAAFVVAPIDVDAMRAACAAAMAGNDALLVALTRARVQRHDALSDAVKAPFDAELFARMEQKLVASLANDARGDALRALLAQTPRHARDISRLAASVFARRAMRVSRLIELSAPAEIVEHDIREAERAIASLDTFDLRARMRAAAHDDAGGDVDGGFPSLELCIEASAAPEGNLSLRGLLGVVEAAGGDVGAAGRPLVDMPYASDDRPAPGALFERVLTAHGVYSDALANELLVEDARRYTSSFPDVIDASAAQDLDDACAETLELLRDADVEEISESIDDEGPLPDLVRVTPAEWLALTIAGVERLRAGARDAFANELVVVTWTERNESV